MVAPQSLNIILAHPISLLDYGPHGAVNARVDMTYARSQAAIAAWAAIDGLEVINDLSVSEIEQAFNHHIDELGITIVDDEQHQRLGGMSENINFTVNVILTASVMVGKTEAQLQADLQAGTDVPVTVVML